MEVSEKRPPKRSSLTIANAGDDHSFTYSLPSGRLTKDSFELTISTDGSIQELLVEVSPVSDGEAFDFQEFKEAGMSARSSGRTSDASFVVWLCYILALFGGAVLATVFVKFDLKEVTGIGVAAAIVAALAASTFIKSRGQEESYAAINTTFTEWLRSKFPHAESIDWTDPDPDSHQWNSSLVTELKTLQDKGFPGFAGAYFGSMQYALLVAASAWIVASIYCLVSPGATTIAIAITAAFSGVTLVIGFLLKIGR